MRRNKESKLNGVRLLNLPDKIVTWDELVLSPEERHIYDSIEKRMQVKFNSLLKRGTVLKHYSMVLVSAFPFGAGVRSLTSDHRLCSLWVLYDVHERETVR